MLFDVKSIICKRFYSCLVRFLLVFLKVRVLKIQHLIYPVPVRRRRREVLDYAVSGVKEFVELRLPGLGICRPHLLDGSDKVFQLFDGCLALGYLAARRGELSPCGIILGLICRQGLLSLGDLLGPLLVGLSALLELAEPYAEFIEIGLCLIALLFPVCLACKDVHDIFIVVVNTKDRCCYQ